MKIKRVFLIVLDSLGIGAAPDAEAFGDKGANTLRRLTAVPDFSLPHLTRLGLSGIDGVTYLSSVSSPIGAYGRMTEKSAGKDTTVGHFEIAGATVKTPFPTYPDGFPDEVIRAFCDAIGQKSVLCNRPYSGTEVIKDFGDAHLRTGKLIVYTSADSVFQIAAHESLYPPERLYEICRTARRLLVGKHGVSRVIARPFLGESGSFYRTENRRDFSIPAPHTTLLDLLEKAGQDVISVGKISDIFAGRGITEAIPSHNNEEGIRLTEALLSRDFHGLCFTNLVDFDMLYGHRNDALGYARALMQFDSALPRLLDRLSDTDCLIITGDHGCDPGDASTDHTREYTPLLIYGKQIKPINLGTRKSFADIGKTVAVLLSVNGESLDGESFADKILR